MMPLISFGCARRVVDHQNIPNGESKMFQKMLSFSAVVAASVFAAASTVSAQTFIVPLSGLQEVPSVTTTGSGTGVATLSGLPGSRVLTYTVNYSGLQGTIAAPFAHIHNGPAGVNATIVHDLDGANQLPISGSSQGTIVGDWRFDDATQPLTDALANEFFLGRLYFNLHTTSFPGGEIRGQIVPEPTTLALLAGAGVLVLRRVRR